MVIFLFIVGIVVLEINEVMWVEKWSVFDFRVGLSLILSE